MYFLVKEFKNIKLNFSRVSHSSAIQYLKIMKMYKIHDKFLDKNIYNKTSQFYPVIIFNF